MLKSTSLSTPKRDFAFVVLRLLPASTALHFLLKIDDYALSMMQADVLGPKLKSLCQLQCLIGHYHWNDGQAAKCDILHYPMGPPADFQGHIRGECVLDEACQESAAVL